MSKLFVLFLGITLLRQIPHMIIHRKISHSKKKFSSDRVGAIIFYAVYFVIWGGSLYYVWCNGIHPFFWSGILVLCCSIMFRTWALVNLNNSYSARIVIYDSHRFVSTGAYSLVRHPLHLALLSELGAMVAISGQYVLGGLIWSCFLLIVLFRNSQEDRVLAKFFGQRALNYQKEVPSMNIIYGTYKHLLQKKGKIIEAIGS